MTEVKDERLYIDGKPVESATLITKPLEIGETISTLNGKDLFLEIEESDIECLREAIIPLYQNSLIRWSSSKIPEVTLGEMNERVALFIGEVAIAAAREYYEGDGDKSLHPSITEAIVKAFTK